MNKQQNPEFIKQIILKLLMAVVCMLPPFSGIADQSERILAGVYRVWWGNALDDPPFVPSPSCARFFPDGTVRLDFCPFSNDGTLLRNEGTRWTAITPCIDNLVQIFWTGSSFSSSQIDPQYPDAIAAVGIRVDLINGDSSTFHGYRDDSCGPSTNVGQSMKEQREAMGLTTDD